MTDDEKLQYILTKFNELQEILTGNPIDISTLECNEKLDFMYQQINLIHPFIIELFQKLSFILKVQNEVSYEVSGDKIDLTTIDNSNFLNELYNLTENISIPILGLNKTNEFKEL